MSQSKRRRENAWKIRKQTPHSHGPVKSLASYAEEYDAEFGNMSNSSSATER